MTQIWFTAQELADIAAKGGLKSFPRTRQGVNERAAKEGWNELPASLCRKRPGREGGGGLEYHFSLLPVAMQSLIASIRVKERMLAAHVDASEADRRRIAALRQSALQPRARSVMEARAEVLKAIEGYAIAKGQPRSWGIARFLEAIDAALARQEIETRRDRGEILTERESGSLARPLVLVAEDGFALSREVLARANDRGAGKIKVSRATIYGWFKVRDQEGVVALAPDTTTETQPIPSSFVEFMRHYARPSKPSVALAHREYLKQCAEPGRALTLDQAAYILREKLNNIEKNIGREGILTLRSRLAYVQRSTEDLWPTTIYTADGKTFDAEIADPVTHRAMRPEITSVLDVATRKCVGVAISRKENVIAVTEALRKSVSAHGICAIFYTDRGAGYKNKTFDGEATPDAAVGGLMGRLGIAKMHALPYNSQAKGIIERFNAHWNDLAKILPTYIGADMDKEAGHKIHKTSRREIAQLGRSNALPSWDEFVALVDQWVAEYNDSEHRGLPKFQDPETGKWRHMSPNEAWAAHVAQGWEPVTVDPHEADDLFRPYEIRTVRRAQVSWNSNDYFHTDLEAYHGRRVMVGYDLAQAEQVWVRELDEETKLPGKLICVAEFGGNRQRYVPLSYQQKAEEDRAKGRLKRIDVRREAALDELRTPLLELQRTVPMPVIPEPEVEPTTNVTSMAPARAVITSDAELAKLCLTDPSQLTPNRARVLREAMSRRSGQELLRISGVDLDELSDLLRSAA